MHVLFTPTPGVSIIRIYSHSTYQAIAPLVCFSSRKGLFTLYVVLDITIVECFDVLLISFGKEYCCTAARSTDYDVPTDLR